MLRTGVPHGRSGKHKKMVTEIIGDLDLLDEDSAMQIPLAELGDTLAKIRSALNRAAKTAGRTIATSSDERFLYLWNVKDKD